MIRAALAIALVACGCGASTEPPSSYGIAEPPEPLTLREGGSASRTFRVDPEPKKTEVLADRTGLEIRTRSYTFDDCFGYCSTVTIEVDAHPGSAGKHELTIVLQGLANESRIPFVVTVEKKP